MARSARRRRTPNREAIWGPRRVSDHAGRGAPQASFETAAPAQRGRGRRFFILPRLRGRSHRGAMAEGARVPHSRHAGRAPSTTLSRVSPSPRFAVEEEGTVPSRSRHYRTIMIRCRTIAELGEPYAARLFRPDLSMHFRARPNDEFPVRRTNSLLRRTNSLFCSGTGNRVQRPGIATRNDRQTGQNGQKGPCFLQISLYSGNPSLLECGVHPLGMRHKNEERNLIVRSARRTGHPKSQSDLGTPARLEPCSRREASFETLRFSDAPQYKEKSPEPHRGICRDTALQT
jgi:hypothetical protein